MEVLELKNWNLFQNAINDLELKTATLKLNFDLSSRVELLCVIFEVSAPEGVAMGSIGGGGGRR